jgi:hypothetical protein
LRAIPPRTGRSVAPPCAWKSARRVPAWWPSPRNGESAGRRSTPCGEGQAGGLVRRRAAAHLGPFVAGAPEPIGAGGRDGRWLDQSASVRPSPSLRRTTSAGVSGLWLPQRGSCLSCRLNGWRVLRSAARITDQRTAGVLPPHSLPSFGRTCVANPGPRFTTRAGRGAVLEAALGIASCSTSRGVACPLPRSAAATGITIEAVVAMRPARPVPTRRSSWRIHPVG